ncbi:MAG: hypothetical protein MZV64_35250 [Ignavibacteriales bacterium]|nr:hypothetical protein [Ignavibacteriales bacterium]
MHVPAARPAHDASRRAGSALPGRERPAPPSSQEDALRARLVQVVDGEHRPSGGAAGYHSGFVRPRLRGDAQFGRHPRPDSWYS